MVGPQSNSFSGAAFVTALRDHRRFIALLRDRGSCLSCSKFNGIKLPVCAPPSKSGPAREMLDIGGRKEQEADDVSRLSDAELIQQLADTAKQLGVEINLNYSFLQQQTSDHGRINCVSGVSRRTRRPVGDTVRLAAVACCAPCKRASLP